MAGLFSIEPKKAEVDASSNPVAAVLDDPASAAWRHFTRALLKRGHNRSELVDWVIFLDEEVKGRLVLPGIEFF
jgi:hypothetical protein